MQMNLDILSNVLVISTFVLFIVFLVTKHKVKIFLLILIWYFLLFLWDFLVYKEYDLCVAEKQQLISSHYKKIIENLNSWDNKLSEYQIWKIREELLIWYCWVPTKIIKNKYIWEISLTTKEIWWTREDTSKFIFEKLFKFIHNLE